MLGLVFLVVPIICLHHALYKIHTWKLFVYGKIFARGKIKSGRKSLIKRKEKESRPKEEVPVEPKFAKHAVENAVSFSLFKCQPWCKNMNNRFEYCNFESCMSIRCLAPQYLFWFFHPCCVFFLCLWQLCSILCRPPQRSTKRSRWKKKTRVCNGLLFLGIG